MGALTSHRGRGEAALAAMLQACSLGISVVNIDGGSAAGIAAYTIAKKVGRFRTQFERLVATAKEAKSTDKHFMS